MAVALADPLPAGATTAFDEPAAATEGIHASGPRPDRRAGQQLPREPYRSGSPQPVVRGCVLGGGFGSALRRQVEPLALSDLFGDIALLQDTSRR
jgi:hypothetical protein